MSSVTQLPAAAAYNQHAIRPGLRKILQQIETNLTGGVLPFWTRESRDQQHGGFFTRLDRAGRPLASTDKCLVSQAGIIWSLAAAHRHGLTQNGYLELAAQGVRFLLDRMWDVTYGGFVWKVSRDGRFVDTRKEVLGQAIAIYALVEFANASGDDVAHSRAAALFDLIEQKAADPRGYYESFTQDWIRPTETPSKTLLTHMHVMAALTALVRASGCHGHVEALSRVMRLLHDLVVDPIDHAPAQSFEEPWRPIVSLRPRATSYGLNVTLASRLLDAADCRGVRERVRYAVLGLVDHAARWGFDHARGGLARYGPVRGHVARTIYFHPRRLTKLWWAQAEFLSALIEAYRMTGAARYLEAFCQEFDWIWTHQIDHESGAWFDATTWRGRPLSPGGNDDWRSPFHEVHALTHVSAALRAIGVA